MLRNGFLRFSTGASLDVVWLCGPVSQARFRVGKFQGVKDDISLGLTRADLDVVRPRSPGPGASSTLPHARGLTSPTKVAKVGPLLV
jgi:hypothetical protein